VFSGKIKGVGEYFVGKGKSLEVSDCQECQSTVSRGCTFLEHFYILKETKYLYKGQVKKLVSKFPVGRVS
jgi:hypothetical protein